MNINPEIVISSGNKDHKIGLNREGMTKEKKSKSLLYLLYIDNIENTRAYVIKLDDLGLHGWLG